MPQHKLIDAEWRSYAEVVLPADAPEIQRVETRRAFYAGASTLLGAILKTLDPCLEPTAEDMRRMDAIHQELEDFARHVRQGRA